MLTVIEACRTALYGPLELIKYLPGGVLSHMGLTRFLVKWIVTIDAPLRRELLRRRGYAEYAKST